MKKHSKCNNLTKYAKKACFRKATAKKGSKSFWNTVRPFFTNRGIITNDSITLKGNRVLNNGTKEINEVFNNYYINIVSSRHLHVQS